MSSKNVYTLFESLRDYLNEETVQLDISLPEEEEFGEVETKEARWIDSLSDDDPGLFSLKLTKSQFKNPRENLLQEQTPPVIGTNPGTSELPAYTVPAQEPFDPDYYYPRLEDDMTPEELNMLAAGVEPQAPQTPYGYTFDEFKVSPRTPEEIKKRLEQVYLPQTTGDWWEETGYKSRGGAQYGERRTIDMVTDISQDWENLQLGDPDKGFGPIGVWDISRKGGGAFPVNPETGGTRHVSHRSGRDIDLGTFKKGAREQSGDFLTPDTVDFVRNYRLAELMINWVADNPDMRTSMSKEGVMRNPIMILWDQKLIDATKKWAEKRVKKEGVWQYANNVSAETNDAMFGTCTERDATTGQCKKRGRTSNVSGGAAAFLHSDGHSNHFHVRMDRDIDKHKIRYPNVKGPVKYSPPKDDKGVGEVRIKTADDEAKDWVWDPKTETWYNVWEGAEEHVFDVSDQPEPVGPFTSHKEKAKRKEKARRRERSRRRGGKPPSSGDSMRNWLKETITHNGVHQKNLQLHEQPMMPMDPIQQQIQMSVQAAQEQLGPLFGQLQGMLVQMRTLNTPAANQEVKRQTNRIELITNDLNDGDVDIMTAIGQLGNIANDMGKKMQKLTQG